MAASPRAASWMLGLEPRLRTVLSDRPPAQGQKGEHHREQPCAMGAGQEAHLEQGEQTEQKAEKDPEDQP
jgi:hypothetical protein